MAVIKHFDCTTCYTIGTIKLKGEDSTLSDIICCPVCSADISEDEGIENEEE